MSDLNQVFDGGLAERVFLIFSIVFMLVYACGILFILRPTARPRRGAAHPRIAIMALFLAVAISAISGGLSLFNPSSGNAANGPASLSITDLQSAIDMKSLPVQKMHDVTFIFDNE